MSKKAQQTETETETEAAPEAAEIPAPDTPEGGVTVEGGDNRDVLVDISEQYRAAQEGGGDAAAGEDSAPAAAEGQEPPPPAPEAEQLPAQPEDAQ
jgi:hypothetical protein